MNKTLKVLVFTKYDSKGASSRLRSMQYFTGIEKANIKIDHSPLFNNEYIDMIYLNSKINFPFLLRRYFLRLLKLITVYKYDLVWIEKELFPWVPLVLEKLLPVLGIPYIVDYDDAIFHNYDQHPRKVIRFLLGNKISKVMNSAKLVTVCNAYLKNKALASGAKKVSVIPTVIDLNRYNLSYDQRNNELTIGWIGTPKTEKYLIELESMFLDLSKIMDFKLIIIGGKNFKTTKFKYEIIPWSADSEARILSEIDIGIMPLTDTKWEQGKCGYKLIQYMASGKPVIASDVGVNCEIVKEGVNGFLAKNDKDWISAFKLLSDTGQRIKMGQEARNLVEKKYSLQNTIEKRITYITENVSAINNKQI